MFPSDIQPSGADAPLRARGFERSDSCEDENKKKLSDHESISSVFCFFGRQLFYIPIHVPPKFCLVLISLRPTEATLDLLSSSELIFWSAEFLQ